MTPLRISAKQLAQFSLDDFCPRCFWVKLKCGGKTPFQTPVPGIFSSLDAFTKRVTRCHFELRRRVPEWFSGFGEVGEPIPVPHHSKFFVIDPDTNIRLTGVPDDVFRQPDGGLFIIDYKTAKWNANQERLLGMYSIQLNAYGFIAESIGLGKVKGLGLIYYQPQTDVDARNIGSIATMGDFAIRFAPKLVPVELDMGRIPPLLHLVRVSADSPVALDGREGCKDCALLDKLVETIGR
jgi:hypothetical protein